nr:hypothetical protein [Tanacetum cinerariifolium]
MPSPSPSPLASLSPPSAGERLARCTAPDASQLPPPRHMPPPVDRRDDIPETKMPPRKRLGLSTLGSRYEIGESSTTRPTGGRGIEYGFVSTLDAKARRRRIGEVRYGIRDTWVDPTEIIPEIAHMTATEPLPPVVSPTVESPEYVAESDPKEDPEEYEDDETEDGPVDYPMDGGDDGDSSGDDVNDEDEDEEDEEKEEEEERLASTDFAVVIPTDELVSPPEGTEPVIPPPSTDTATTGASHHHTVRDKGVHPFVRVVIHIVVASVSFDSRGGGEGRGAGGAGVGVAIAVEVYLEVVEEAVSFDSRGGGEGRGAGGAGVGVAIAVEVYLEVVEEA